MPRQLPWVKSSGSGGRSRTQTIKPSSRGAQTTSISGDIDDDFLGGTVLASSNRIKGKGRAEAALDFDDLLSGYGPSIPRISKLDDTKANERAPSSSPPPPPAEYARPHDEPMHKGVSKGDLRDDEWMMVEDELLQTANMFTRHLHIAEYDRLKASIEAKKREAETARPVTAGAQRSVEGVMRHRAKIQEAKQKKAIRNVLVSQGDSSEDNRASYRPKSTKSPSSVAKPPRPTTSLSELDIDDLDATHLPKSKASTPSTATAAKPLPATRPRPVYLQTFKSSTEPTTRPAPPATTTTARSRSRPTRMTPFEMLDEYNPPAAKIATPRAPTSRVHASASSLPSTSSMSSSQLASRIPQPKISQTDRLQQSVNLLDGRETLKDRGGMSKEVADRIAKRKSDRATGSGGKEKKRATDVDDIPTFLF